MTQNSEFRNDPYLSTPNFVTNSPSSSKDTFWLAWLVDLKDLEGSLTRAVRRFREKPTWGGKAPTVLKCRADLAEKIEPIAARLGLTVVVDRTVTPGLVFIGREGDDD